MTYFPGELDTTRPVPFRLTPNIMEYISPIGVSGPLTASMIAISRCFVYPNFKVIFSSDIKKFLLHNILLFRFWQS